MIDRNIIPQLNQYLEPFNPAEVLYWLIQNDPGRIVMTSSFQPQSVPLLYLVSKICPLVPILFLDTGFHFPETIEYLEDLKKALNIRIVSLRSSLRHDKEPLYETNPDMCCYLRKVEPLQNILKNYDVWISGIRRDQTTQRANTPILAFDSKNQIIKVCPMANATMAIVTSMTEKLKLPINPLLGLGYLSVGCYPCTKLPNPDDPRSGRWQGLNKTECGLHLPNAPHDTNTQKKERNI